MNYNYMTIQEYFEEKSKLIGKIATYDLLIDGMEKAVLEATLSGHLTDYELDDGQMKCRARYRSITDMTNAMNGLMKLRQMFINQLNGRTVVLRGGNL